MIVYNKRGDTYHHQHTLKHKVRGRGSKPKRHTLTLKNKLILKSLGFKVRV